MVNRGAWTRCAWSLRGDHAVAEATFAMGAGDAVADVVQDVSHVALFSSTDPTVVEVDDDGPRRRRGEGQAWVMARFGNPDGPRADRETIRARRPQHLGTQRTRSIAPGSRT